MLIRTRTASPGPSSKTNLRVIAFNRNRQVILRQLAMLLLFGLSLLNTLLWQGVPLSWILADMALTLLAGIWVLSRYFGFGNRAKPCTKQTH